MSKTEVIKIRCTTEERKSLECDGLTLSASIRAKLFGGASNTKSNPTTIINTPDEAKKAVKPIPMPVVAFDNVDDRHVVAFPDAEYIVEKDAKGRMVHKPYSY